MPPCHPHGALSRYQCPLSRHQWALALSKGLDRDRAVDETGHQIAITGRLGSRPFTRPEMERLFRGADGAVFRVTDDAHMDDWIAGR